MSAETTLAHHLKAIGMRNVDTILEDYADDAVLITDHVTVRGREQLRPFFTQALQILMPEWTSQFQILRQDAAGEVAYIFWKAGPRSLWGRTPFWSATAKSSSRRLPGSWRNGDPRAAMRLAPARLPGPR